mgnify:CR=1 FL=1
MRHFIDTEETFTDITELVKGEIPEGDGLCVVFTPHTTCAIAILENESLLMKDMESYLERIAPKNGVYAHDDIEHRDVPPTERINGFSHIRAMQMTPSMVIPYADGQLLLGEWQAIFLVELDPARKRQVIVWSHSE